MINFCTYFDWNYRDKGLALYESLEQHVPTFRLWTLALDERTEDLLNRLHLPHMSPIAMSSFEYPALTATRTTRNVREFYWTCTPGWVLFVLDHSPETHVNQIDADCYFFSNPAPMFQEIGSRSLAITPHDFPPRLRSFTRNGVFNVGLVHVKEDETGLGCIREWEQQCLDWCYLQHDPAHPDKFCDQKYLDKWPGKWGAHAIQHPGANRAPWNAEHRAYTVRDGRVLVDGKPLIWWHYHGYESSQRMYPSTYYVSALQKEHIYKPYEEALKRANERIGSVR